MAQARYNENVMGILSNDIRIEILKQVTEGQLTVSQFFKYYNDTTKKDRMITIQELSKHFKKLHSAGMIKRNKDDSFSVTPFGYVLQCQIPFFRLFLRQTQYLNSHAIDKLPERFARTIAVLSNSTVITNHKNLIKMVAAMIGHARKYLKTSVISYPPQMVGLIAEAVKSRNLDVFYIFGPNTITPKKRDVLLAKTGWWNLISGGQIKRRMLTDTIFATILVTEEDALISFCKNKGSADYSMAFYGNYDFVRTWCDDLFMHMWNGGHMFDESRITESNRSKRT